MKVLIIGDKKHVFVYNLVKWIRRTNPRVTTLDVIHRNGKKYQTDHFYDDVYSYESLPASLPLVRRLVKERSRNKYFKKKIQKLEKNYDIVHIHYIEHRLVENADFLAENITGKLVVSIWGSDFYRSNEENRLKILPILKRADLITFENPEMMRELHHYYLENHGTDLQSLTIVRFGLEPLEELEKLKMTKEECQQALNIPEGRITICIGYNAFPGQQHVDILKSFLTVKDILIDKKVCLIVPLTYGGDANYIGHIKKELHRLGVEFVVLSSFLDDGMVARLRMASDYFLNLQITDQLSGSMLEHLYAGSVVITGSWLPYGVLDELGVELYKVDEVSRVGDLVSKLLLNGASEIRIEHNRKAIYDFSYWGNCIKSWNELYD